MPTVAPKTRVGDDGSGSDAVHAGTVNSKGWSLRLLLSLEERERTRTRLLAMEVVAGVVADIIDVIPSKVGDARPQLFLFDVLRSRFCASIDLYCTYLPRGSGIPTTLIPQETASGRCRR